MGDFEYSINYQAKEYTELVVKDSIFYPMNSDTITEFGLELNTTSVVDAHAYHFRNARSEASILYPTELIGYDYIINTSTTSHGLLLIVGTENNTEIEIIPTNNTINGHPSNTPLNIVLNEGETFQIRSVEDLSGSTIRSVNQKKISVFSGSKHTNQLCDGQSGANPLYDQLLPTELLGNEYALIPINKNTDSFFKITALIDDTRITTSTTDTIFLNSKESYDLSTDSALLIHSNSPILVSHFLCNDGEVGDPNMINLLPTKFTTNEVNFKKIMGFDIALSSRFTEHRISIIKENSDSTPVLLNSIDINNQFNEITENASYSYATIDLEDEFISLESNAKLQAYLYGLGGFDAYSLSLGFTPNTISSNQIINHKKCEVYPNPALDIINLDCEYNEALIFSITGKIVKRIISSSNINVSGLTSGLYIIVMHNKESAQAIKFIKN